MRFVHSCIRVHDAEASVGLPGEGDTPELTVNGDREEPPGGRQDVGRICFVRDPDGYRVELSDQEFPMPQDPADDGEVRRKA